MRQRLESFNLPIGIATGVVTLLAFKGDDRVLGVLILLALMVLLNYRIVYKLKIGFRKSLHQELEKCPMYRIRQAEINDIKSICDLQKVEYKALAIPESLYLEWFKANSEGFFVMEKENIFTKECQIVGHVTFFSIKAERLALYIEGEILEEEIRGVDIYGPDERDKIDHIYIESVIACLGHRRYTIPMLTRLYSSMLSLYCGNAPVKTVYAMAATDDGTDSIQGAGFKVIKRLRRRLRKDKKEMYYCDFSDFIAFVRKREAEHEMKIVRRRTILPTSTPDK